MKVSLDFGRWTTMKAAIAVAGALVIGGAVGSAVAFSPTVAPPIKWQGGWEFAQQVQAGLALLNTVPAGLNLIVTDLVVSNQDPSSIRVLELYTGLGGECEQVVKTRLAAFVLNPKETLNIPLQTGIGFAAGQRVCLNVAGGTTSVSARGFLFTPQPVS